MLSDIANFQQIGLSELKGSRSGKRDRGVFTGERIFQVRAEYAMLLEHALLGYPIATGAGIFWSSADQWPGRPDTTCRTADIEYGGTVTGTARDQIGYTWAKITAQYSNSFDGVSGQTNPDPVTSPIETAIASGNFGATVFNMSKRSLQFTSNGKPVPQDIAPTATVLHREISVPVTNSDKAPSAFDAYAGKINSVPFVGAAIETVLYLGADFSQKKLVVPAVPLPAISSRPPTTLIVWDYTHKFAVRPAMPWSQFINPETGLPDTITIISGGGLFKPYGDPVDLNGIFQK